MIKRKLHIIVSACIALVLLSVTLLDEKSTTKNTFTCTTTQESFTAGKPITLKFKGNFENKPQLYIIHSYGRTLLDGVLKKDIIHFNLPKNYYNKTSLVSWLLIENNEEKAKGNFQIVPNDETKTNFESYLGPPSTLVGEGHFTMFVTIPTDNFDNPKLTNTEVAIKHQFLNTIATDNEKTKDFIAWKNIYAPTKSGVVLISASCNEAITKEFDAVIYPSIATDFSITHKRNHEFADGNQITELTTSIIKDKFGNTVSDGTMVTFIIKNKENVLLKTFGTTIEGVATGQILHPEKENNYTVKAYVNGISKSNSIEITYKSINPTVEFSFSKGNRTITVGQIKSFMNQIVPDGIKINLNIYHKDKLIETITENSSRGKAIFYLSPEFYKEKKYRFEIETLGKTIKTAEKNVSNK
ncbi:MAG: hypothetical protein HC854_11325 [Flavobacterium sp.]|nr:hypothetical protein [Flavobacterium sp.]